MKTFSFLCSILLLASFTLSAQQWSGPTNSTATIYRTGNVGIGTSTSSSKLTVAGEVNIGAAGNARLKVRTIVGKSHNSTDIDHLFLNYNTGKNIYAGYGPTTSSLFVGQNLTTGGSLFTGGSIQVGGSTNANITVRHVNGKEHDGTAHDNLYLNYNTGKPVYIGYGGKKSNLYVNGENHINGGWVRVYGSKGLFFQNYGGGINMIDNVWVRVYGNKSFYHKSGAMRTDGTLQAGPNGDRFLVKTDGKVGINTTTPDYQLDVNGTIRAKEVRVQTGWSDYVFLPEYKLPTLQEEESFINKNGHLLGFESEKDMDGEVQLADVTNRQQAKIEEMMLHLIEMNKKLEQVIDKNQQLQKENDQLKKSINRIVRK